MSSSIALLKNLTLLYAEDDQVIRNSISRVLERFFKNVLIASDGIEALELYENNQVHVVLLDYVMPVMSGYDVAFKIRQNDDTIPIIIASAYTDKEKLLSSIPLKLTQYIEKPITYENLTDTFSLIIAQMEKSNTLFVKLNETLSYNYINKTISRTDASEIALSKNEVEFLELLLKRPNQLISKDLAEERIYKNNVDQNTLRNMIYRLRKKLNIEEQLIITIKDLGYMIKID